jgi:outer membrane protein assembly factor BamB
VFASPVVTRDGLAVFGGLDGTVLAVDGQGVTRWAWSAPARVFSSPAWWEDTVVLGHDGRAFVGLDRRGRVRWEVATTEDADSPPVVGPDGVLYLASRELLAVDATTGTERWRAALQGHAFGAPALGPDGTVWVTELSGALVAFRARDGAQGVRVALPGAVHGGALVLDDGGVVVAVSDGHVRAFNTDGSARWDSVLEGTGRSLGSRGTPALTPGGVVVLGAEDGAVYGLRAGDGGRVFRTQTFGPVRASIRIDADGWLFVGSEDDRVYGLAPDGSVGWSVSVGADVDSSPALLPDGALVVGADDGALHCLRAP